MQSILFKKHAHVSKEEWVFRGLAIAMCLAMMGMAVMPTLLPCNLYGEYMLHTHMRKDVNPIGEAAANAVALADGLIWTGLLVGVASGGAGAIPALFVLGTGAALW